MSSVPVCTYTVPQFSNSLGQGPCYIATALGNACNMPGDTALTLPSLNASAGQFAYPAPSTANAANSCLCSTVYYSLLSACSFCQTGYYLSWGNYSQGCTSTAISLSSFPRPIPAGTSVPHYAYLDVVVNTDGFNYSAAVSAGGAESSPISSIPNATSISAGSSTAFTTSAITTSTGSDSVQGRSSIRAGAIVEGTVGFLMLLAILGLVWFYKFRRKGATSVQRFPLEPDVRIRPQPLLRRKSTDW